VEIKSFKELIGVWDGKLTVLDFSFNEIKKLYDSDPESDGYSNINGWQKIGLHKMPQFNPLKEMIINRCYDYPLKTKVRDKSKKSKISTNN